MRKGWMILLVLVLLGAFFAAHCQTAREQQGGDEIMLPDPKTTGDVSVEEAIGRRRSIRSFTDEALTIDQISQLAWAAQGITEPSSGFRAAPSAGATYPMEMYLVAPDGIHHYQPDGHKLLQVSETDARAALSQAALGQRSVQQAALDIVIAAVFQRTTARYGDRGRQYVYMEAGHIAENIHLQAVALGLGSVPVGAFDDAQVADVLDLPDDQEPIYIIPVGHPR